MNAKTVPSTSPSQPIDTKRIHLVQSILSPVPLIIDQTPQPGPALASTFFERRIVEPIAGLLRYGCTPRRLAWSISVGLLVGINPLLGSTTVVSLAAAGVFRLNLVASQIAAHAAYPIEVALFFVFIRLGNRVFHTGHLPLHREALLVAIRHHPWQTTRLLWTWEWHALAVWAAAAILLAPLLAVLLTPLVARLNPSPAQPQLVR